MRPAVPEACRLRVRPRPSLGAYCWLLICSAAPIACLKFGSPLPRPLGALLFKFESESSGAQLRMASAPVSRRPHALPARVLRDPALITGVVRPCVDLVAFVVPKTMHTNRRLRLCLVLSFWSLQAVTLVTHISHTVIYSPSSADASFHVPEPWPLAWIPQNLRPLIEVFAAPQPPPRGLKSSLRSTDMLMQ